MELQRNVGINSQGKVVVDHIQRKIVLAIFGVRHGSVRFNLQAPPIQQDRVRVTDVAQNLPNRLVRIALPKRKESRNEIKRL